MKRYEVVIRESTYRHIEVWADDIQAGVDEALRTLDEMRPQDDATDHAEVVAIEEAGWRDK
jgi:hypothetical protein